MSNNAQDGAVDYEPNSFDGPTEDTSERNHGDQLEGKTGNYTAYVPDNFSAAGALYNVLSEEEKRRLVTTIASNLGQVEGEHAEEIKTLETRQFYQDDPDYGTRVAEALGLNLDDIK
ncbi:MAG: hypothetical protein J6575_00880 [Bifidobacterium sp.]|nr:hypothetical protein [Bifidobacterium sp.]